MSISRIAAYKQTKNTAVFIVVCDGQEVRLNWVDLPEQANEAAVAALMRNAARDKGVTLPDFDVHKNEDGSFWIAMWL